MSLTTCWHHRGEDDAFNLMRDICMNWRVKYYVKDLKISCRGERASYIEDQEDTKSSDGRGAAQEYLDSIVEDIDSTFYERPRRESLDPIVDVIRRMIEECGDAITLPGWLDGIKDGEVGDVLGLLMVALINLETISVSDCTHKIECFKMIMAQIAGSSGTRILSHLRSTHLNATRDIDFRGLGECFDYFPIFAAVPAIRSLSGFAVTSTPEDLIGGPVPCQRSSFFVTDFHLDRSNIDSGKLATFVGAIRDLQRFSYNYRRVRGGENHPREDHLVIAALRRNFAGTLQGLSLTGEDAEAQSALRGSGWSIMRVFPVLTEVTLDHWFHDRVFKANGSITRSRSHID